MRQIFRICRILYFWQLFWKCVPALCLQRHFIAVTGYHGTSEFRLGDVSDNSDAVNLRKLLMCGKRGCEKQLVILSAIKGGSHQIHIDFRCHYSRLIINWNTFFVNPATGIALLADVEQFWGQTVRNVHHCRWYDTGISQCLDDIFASLMTARAWISLTMWWLALTWANRTKKIYFLV